ncbi:LysR family transcriptional regulator [Oribacterium sp. HCP28S3_H8]|uniref:LysR family transcriptional regulator n=1 Tax=Oribacterium sp. HCP28S3_H8 TaxID=3438945 RepID=UPI003F88FD6F
MDIEDIRRIAAVVECGSINKAAEQLHIAQPALSRTIRKVEAEYHISIFDRSKGKQSEVTEAGELYLNMAKEILLVHNAFLAQLERRRQRDEKRILFGLAPQQAIAISSKMLQWFYKNGAGYMIDIRSASSRRLHEDVMRGEIDVACLSVTRFKQGLHYEKSSRAYTSIYLSKQSALLSKTYQVSEYNIPVVCMKDLIQEPVIANREGSASYNNIRLLCEKFNCDVTMILEDNMYQRMHLADEGEGNYVFTATGSDLIYSCADSGRFVRLDPKDDIEQWKYLVCRNGFEKTEGYEALRNCLAQCIWTIM